MIDSLNIIAKWFFSNLDTIIIVVTISAFLLHKAISFIISAEDSDDTAMRKAFAAAGIPNGLAFIICAISPDFVGLMQGAQIPFAIAGLALLSITFKQLMEFTRPTPEAERSST